MKIHYKIEMLSDWHVGSGLDSGADADNIVLKDDDNLPYIPGKTIKGLLKDSLLDIADVDESITSDIETYFGKVNKDKSTESGNLFFSDAHISEDEKEDITSNHLSNQLYKNIASTRIDENGIAKRNSLRVMEVCIPISLAGEIEGEKIDESLFEKAFKWTRHLGVNRNRGLGRCIITLTKN
jgi:CRISPR/Cas system CSM-associated protein Csm3 (group 7 of RAMP superfamily)